MEKETFLSKKKLIEYFYITVGVAITSFAFSFFLNPLDLVIGGVSGVGILLKNIISGFDPAFTIFIVNIILLFLGLFLLGKDFFIKTAYGSIVFPFFIYIFSKLYEILKIDDDIQNLDMVLIVLFASILSGVGLGIVLKYGGTTGGTEVLQKIFHKFFHLSFSTSLYILDGLVIVAGLLTKVTNFQIFLYAIIFTSLCGQVIDAVVYSGFNRRAVYIISKKNEEIKKYILQDFERGLTSIKVIGEYTKNEQEMLLCVLNSNEYNKLKTIINEVDASAFYFVVRASEVGGEGFTYD